MAATALLTDISYNKNWNNKLSCECYTTIRLYNPNKHQVGFRFNASLQGKFLHQAEIIDVKVFRLQDLNDFMSYLDTGLPAEKAKEMIRTMYKKLGLNWETQPLAFILQKQLPQSKVQK